jgi:integrase
LTCEIEALILIGFTGALRHCELVALDVDDVQEDADGLVLAPTTTL